jgi:hypothetical protein
VNARVLLLSIVTGLGHVYLRHYIRGAILFVLFATFLNGIFLGSMIESRPDVGKILVHACVPLALAVWVAGMAHAYTISYGTDRNRLRTERQKLFREGLLAYLRDELDASALSLTQAAERDVDWEDSDILFHLGVVELRRSERSWLSGERRTAERARLRSLKAFRSCLARDEKKKWRAEIDVERQRAKNPPRPVTRVLMAVPKLESTDDAIDDDTAELTLPKSGMGKVLKDLPPSPDSDTENPSPSPSNQPGAAP